MTEHGGEDTPCGRMEEEREVEEREEDRPARVEEQEARSVAHGEREEVVAEVEAADEPGGDRELRATDVGCQEGLGLSKYLSENAPR